MTQPITALASAGALIVALSVLASPAGAQQWAVDDAEIVDRGACQVEAWHGERTSWILPGCQPLPNLEIAIGAGFVDEGGGHRETEYAVEAKTLFRPLSEGGWGVGLVLGVGPNPSAEPDQRRFGDVYAFVPASLALADDRLVLHGEDDDRPAYQLGLRIHRPDAGVEVDLSWGGHTHSDLRGAGFTVGLAFVSGRIF